MPYSTNAGKLFFQTQFNARPEIKTVIDVGAGNGGYTKYRKPGQTWYGIEVWAPYVKEFELEKKYDRVVVSDARYLDWRHFGFTERLVIFGDILEHMEFFELQCVLIEVVKAGIKHIYISSPIGHVPQGEWGGNPFETHRHDFSHAETLSLLENFGTVDFELNDEDRCHTMGCYWLTVK